MLNMGHLEMPLTINQIATLVNIKAGVKVLCHRKQVPPEDDGDVIHYQTNCQVQATILRPRRVRKKEISGAGRAVWMILAL